MTFQVKHKTNKVRKQMCQVESKIDLTAGARRGEGEKLETNNVQNKIKVEQKDPPPREDYR